jgi:hypothetical protein
LSKHGFFAHAALTAVIENDGAYKRKPRRLCSTSWESDNSDKSSYLNPVYPEVSWDPHILTIYTGPVEKHNLADNGYRYRCHL